MKRRTCYKCGDYQIVADHGEVIRAYAKPVVSIMVPAYLNKVVEGKQKWVRVGYLCTRCGFFEYSPLAFKPFRHAV